MITELTAIIKPEEEKNSFAINRVICEELAKKNIKARTQQVQFQVLKKSIDARHGRQKLVLRLKVFIV